MALCSFHTTAFGIEKEDIWFSLVAIFGCFWCTDNECLAFAVTTTFKEPWSRIIIACD